MTTSSFCLSSWHTDSCSLELLACSELGLQVVMSVPGLVFCLRERHLCSLHSTWATDCRGKQRWAVSRLVGQEGVLEHAC